ncbi:UNKNOWN [Stylonychia lemnae]|uniref:Uncharacterized protein n=1 Tax=Stylonychia lemnae TaxID=5949 RepID=A0A078A105_STYLE|nr:UNKNOWN [Stylonychia lemnae]|eukprot:CDW74464.1 UNKNOWN [Stylonychia lemnae]
MMSKGSERPISSLHGGGTFINSGNEQSNSLGISRTPTEISNYYNQQTFFHINYYGYPNFPPSTHNNTNSNNQHQNNTFPFKNQNEYSNRQYPQSNSQNSNQQSQNHQTKNVTFSEEDKKILRGIINKNNNQAAGSLHFYGFLEDSHPLDVGQYENHNKYLRTLALLSVSDLNSLKDSSENNNIQSNTHLYIQDDQHEIMKNQLTLKNNRIEFLEKKIQLLEEQSNQMKERLKQNTAHHEQELKIKEELHQREVIYNFHIQQNENLLKETESIRNENDKIRKEFGIKEKALMQQIQQLKKENMIQMEQINRNQTIGAQSQITQASTQFQLDAQGNLTHTRGSMYSIPRGSQVLENDIEIINNVNIIYPEICSKQFDMTQDDINESKNQTNQSDDEALIDQNNSMSSINQQVINISRGAFLTNKRRTKPIRINKEEQSSQSEPHKTQSRLNTGLILKSDQIRRIQLSNQSTVSGMIPENINLSSYLSPNTLNRKQIGVLQINQQQQDKLPNQTQPFIIRQERNEEVSSNQQQNLKSDSQFGVMDKSYFNEDIMLNSQSIHQKIKQYQEQQNQLFNQHNNFTNRQSKSQNKYTNGQQKQQFRDIDISDHIRSKTPNDFMANTSYIAEVRNQFKLSTLSNEQNDPKNNTTQFIGEIKQQSIGKVMSPTNFQSDTAKFFQDLNQTYNLQNSKANHRSGAIKDIDTEFSYQHQVQLNQPSNNKLSIRNLQNSNRLGKLKIKPSSTHNGINQRETEGSKTIMATVGKSSSNQYMGHNNILNQTMERQMQVVTTLQTSHSFAQSQSPGNMRNQRIGGGHQNHKINNLASQEYAVLQNNFLSNQSINSSSIVQQKNLQLKHQQINQINQELNQIKSSSESQRQKTLSQGKSKNIAKNIKILPGQINWIKAPQNQVNSSVPKGNLTKPINFIRQNIDKVDLSSQSRDLSALNKSDYSNINNLDNSMNTQTQFRRNTNIKLAQAQNDLNQITNIGSQVMMRNNSKLKKIKTSQPQFQINFVNSNNSGRDQEQKASNISISNTNQENFSKTPIFSQDF